MRSGRIARSTSSFLNGCLSSADQSRGSFSSSGVTWLNHSMNRKGASRMSAGSFVNSSMSASAAIAYHAATGSHGGCFDSTGFRGERSRFARYAGLTSSSTARRRMSSNVSWQSRMSLWRSSSPRETQR